MEKKQINKVPLGIGWEILWKAWDMAKVNYRLSVLISVIIFPLLLIPSIIGFVMGFTNIILLGEIISSANVHVINQIFGIIIVSFITALVPVFHTICAFHWEKRELYSLMEILSDLKDKKNIKLFFPVVTVSFLLSSLSGIIGIFNNMAAINDMVLTYIFTIPISMFMFILIFCYPILFLKPEMGLVRAFIQGLQGILKNILPFIIGFILMVFLFVACAICLLLPVILVAMPVSVSFYYLWYRVIFEDLKLESDETPII